jgi:transcriptional regulator with XRE-family HTH domain
MNERTVFPALLRHWRSRHGLSQLDLAAAADVSARHISFLETGRARPSRDMVLRLAATLNVPLREQNALLNAAGFSDAFLETGLGDAMDPTIRQTLEHMLSHHEPYPLVVMNRHYDLLMSNHGAARLIQKLLGERATSDPINILKLTFDPSLLQPFIEDWESIARFVLGRLHRELLQNPSDRGLTQLLTNLYAYPSVPAEWRVHDLATPSHAVLPIRFKLEGETLAFLTAVTVFNAPQNVTVEELRIESYYPLDDQTKRACERLALRPLA